jgi:hypothetical protein
MLKKVTSNHRNLRIIIFQRKDLTGILTTPAIDTSTYIPHRLLQGVVMDPSQPKSSKQSNYTTKNSLSVHFLQPSKVTKIMGNRCHKHISNSDFVSIPDETFRLLILENNFDKWEQYVANGRKCDIAKKTQTKFAPTVRSTNWASNTAALTRYNAYYRMIQQRRLDSEQQDIEKEIMESFQEEYGSKIRRTGKRRFAEMNGTTEGNEETMPPLPIAAIDSFA